MAEGERWMLDLLIKKGIGVYFFKHLNFKLKKNILIQ